MLARAHQLFYRLMETFWLVPASVVIAATGAAIGLIQIDSNAISPSWLLDNPLIYSGGAEGARTLLGAVATSTITVAGTVFTITIAALSLAASQMGPRLLRNFTRDRGNQCALGIFMGTFAYALIVLRSVRTEGEGEFVPHLALSGGLLLGFLCIATLIWFVGHMAGRINVETVIDLVSEDICLAIENLRSSERLPNAPPESFWQGASPIEDDRAGYLAQLEADQIADWAAENNTAIRFLVRPGEYVFPKVPFALMTPPVAGAAEALKNSTVLSGQRLKYSEFEYTMSQLVDVALRSLSPAINDPYTAISVLERLGSSLCQLSGISMPGGAMRRDGRVVLVMPRLDYSELLDSLFEMIRQKSAGDAFVLSKMVNVMAAVTRCERDPSRLEALKEQVDLALAEAEKTVNVATDIEKVRRRHASFMKAYRARNEAQAPDR